MKTQSNHNMGGLVALVLCSLTLTFLTGCASGSRMTAYSAGGGASASSGAVSIPSSVGLEVFGNQPTQPTPGSVQTTLGAVYSGHSLYANEARSSSRALVQQISGSTPILFDQANGWAWKQACHNRVTPYVAPEAETQVSGAAIVQTSTVNNAWKFSIVDNLSLAVAFDGSGGGYSSGYSGYSEPDREYRTRRVWHTRKVWRGRRAPAPERPCPPVRVRPTRPSRPEPCPPGYIREPRQPRPQPQQPCPPGYVPAGPADGPEFYRGS
jgi:hypothetical protein